MTHLIKFGYLSFLCLCCWMCSSKQEPPATEVADPENTEFVYMEDELFKYRGEQFYPLCLQYTPSFMEIDGSFVCAPSAKYVDGADNESKTKQEIHNLLKGHFRLIHDFGFNTLRIPINNMRFDDKKRGYYRTQNKQFFIADDATTILEGLKDLVRIASEENLRIIFVLQQCISNPELEHLIIDILRLFAENPTIIAYDFIDTPLYSRPFDTGDKVVIERTVNQWLSWMRTYAPNQLFTIGFTEPTEVFRWDPSMLNVDFVSMQSSNPLSLFSEIYWYNRYVKRPWLLIATGITAKRDTTSFAEQQQFMREAMQYARNCGSLGFGWNTFQTSLGSSVLGLLTRKGMTKTDDGAYNISGSETSIARTIKAFPTLKPQPIERPGNYFNILGYKNIALHGKIIDIQTKQPIEGAVIRGWNFSFTVGCNTFSNENGEFTLYSNDICRHLEISAPHMNRFAFAINPPIYDKHGGLIKNPKKALADQLPDQFLESLKICYSSFLREPTPNDDRRFIFDTSLFNQWSFTAEINKLYLRPIHLREKKD